MQIIKVYSGRAGACMCGCAGRWSYTAYGAQADNPGYEPNVNERSVKIIANRVLNSPAKQEDAGMVYTEEGGRIRAVYFK